MRLSKYSEVVSAGLILPKRSRYTVADCKDVMVSSLFRPEATLSRAEASFVVRCSAIYHGTDFSRNVRKFGEELPIF